MAILAPRDAALAMLSAELASPKRTKRSLGVLYGFCLATFPHDDADVWRGINGPIISATDIRYLSAVKNIGWEHYQAVAERSS